MEPTEESGSQAEDEGNSLDWLLQSNPEEIVLAPMDSNVTLARPPSLNRISETFTRERIFKAASQGDRNQLDGLLDFLQSEGKKLTSPELTDQRNGKTALLKALLNLKDGKNDTIQLFLDIAEQTKDLEHFINASYTDPFYRGQSPLHVAIERRSFELVELLVQKGADVQAKADGSFFQQNGLPGFYYGELPLSLAACTNQPAVVSFLMENPHNCAAAADKDSQGNTVLHALVVICDNTPENTEMIIAIYNDILKHHHRLEKNVHLEAIENNCGLTPLKLAAKLGKIGLLQHMMHREFKDEDTRALSRKFTEWVYGPVHSSLYDISSIDTSEENSVLEIVVVGSEIPNRPEILKLEPLRSLLKDKWDRFASKLFLMNFLGYLIYLLIFTTAAFYRKEGKPPFAPQDPADYARCVGEIFSIAGAVWFLYKAIKVFMKTPPKFSALYTDGFSDILFFLQASLLIVVPILYFCGRSEYVGLLVISLALAWINVLHYSRGSKQMGIYNVMMQRMILGDILHFLVFYCVFLFGFSAAIVALIEDEVENLQASVRMEPLECKKPSYNDFQFTLLEMFKFTIGMGDLQFTDHVQYKEVFYVLLILYICLTYILMLNMLIALMGHTVEVISQESESIWNLQRAYTILDMERSLLKRLLNRFFPRESNVICFEGKPTRFLRVEEVNWKQWRSDLSVIGEEFSGEGQMEDVPDKKRGTIWDFSLISKLRPRRRPRLDDKLP
ncbi:transient receptor potential cation channel subfamily V member 1-like [Synchiropus picturatus]